MAQPEENMNIHLLSKNDSFETILAILTETKKS